jgi:hypothetical protein
MYAGREKGEQESGPGNRGRKVRGNNSEVTMMRPWPFGDIKNAML